MKNFLNFDIKLLLIVLLIGIVYFQNCNDNENETTVKIDGRKYNLVKIIIDTVEVPVVTVKNVKGDDIYHENYSVDTAVILMKNNIDTQKVIYDYYSKRVYKDTLTLKDSLGYVSIIDTISENRLITRSWYSDIKKKTITETKYLTESPKNEYYVGINANLDKLDFVNSVGFNLMYKSSKNKIYQFNTGIANKPLNSQSRFTPYIGGTIFWKIK